MFPANNLEKYFEELNTHNWTLIPIEHSFARQLQKSAESKFLANNFKAAKISREEELNTNIRNDSIFWLDKNSEGLSNPDYEVLKNLTFLTEALKNYFRISLNEFECHYSVFEKGHFYKKHQDTTFENNKRFFSFVIYLNDFWSSDDGGQLIGFQNEKSIFEISPKLGQMILFKSDLEHEVLKTNKKRFSLTGWVRK